MSEVVNYDDWLAFLKKASLYEIYRLSLALEIEQRDPKRVLQVAQKINIKDTIEYFDPKTRQLVTGIVVEKTRTSVLVCHLAESAVSQVPYYMINIDSRSFFTETKNKNMTRHDVAIGMRVGFVNSRTGTTVSGVIERINPKTVSLRTPDNQVWRVSYALLFPVIEGQTGVIYDVLPSR